jgi:hypothetical protein
VGEGGMFFPIFAAKELFLKNVNKKKYAAHADSPAL